jgi:hypothetical protein
VVRGALARQTMAGAGGWVMVMGGALTIRVGREQGYATVTVAGEIDIATVARLRERPFRASGQRPAADSRPGPGQLHRLCRARGAGRRSPARRRARGQPARDLHPAPDPTVVSPDRAGPPDTAGPHPGRGTGVRGCPGHTRQRAAAAAPSIWPMISAASMIASLRYGPGTPAATASRKVGACCLASSARGLEQCGDLGEGFGTGYGRIAA